MPNSTAPWQLSKVSQRMVQSRPTMKTNSPYIGTFLSAFVLHLSLSLTRHLLTLAYTSKVLTRIELLKPTRKINVIRLTATMGNVTSSRPSIFDMLGRAKWWVSLLLAFTFALPLYMISRVNHVRILTLLPVGRVPMIQGCVGEAQRSRQI